MKNLILALFFGLMISLTSNYRVIAQEPTQITVSDSGETLSQPQQLEKQGFFARIWDTLKGKATDGITVFIFGIIAGIFTKHGWTLIIKRIANKGKVVLKEFGEFSTAGSNFLDTLDNKIRDDGTLEENSVKDLMQAGKPLIAEGKDFIFSIKPVKK